MVSRSRLIIAFPFFKEKCDAKTKPLQGARVSKGLFSCSDSLFRQLFDGATPRALFPYALMKAFCLLLDPYHIVVHWSALRLLKFQSFDLVHIDVPPDMFFLEMIAFSPPAIRTFPSVFVGAATAFALLHWISSETE